MKPDITIQTQNLELRPLDPNTNITSLSYTRGYVTVV